MPKTIRPVHPNAGLQQLYKRRLVKMVDDMAKSVSYWVLAAYRQNPPAVARLAQDAEKPTGNAASIANQVVDELTKRWLERFEEGGRQLGKYFATAAQKRSSAQLQKILRDSGFAVDFKMTRAQREILQATVQENVSLIKSIPEQYLKSVETAVTQAVTNGMDVGTLAKKLESAHGVTKRRAKIISQDQSTKANSAFVRARQLEIGAEKAIWMHSHAGKKPRPTHLANNGKEYDLKTGWYDPDVGEHIFPGQLINCRCTSRTVIPGFI